MQVVAANSKIPAWHAWSVVASVSIISFLLIGTTIASLGVYMPVFQSHFGWSEGDVGGIAAVLLLGVSLASISAGWVLNKIGPRNLIMAGVIIVACGCLLAARASSLTQMVLAIGFVGAGIGTATIVPGTTVINLWFREKRGIPMAAFIGSLVLSSALIPRLTDSLIGSGGWRSALTITSISVAAIGLCLAIFVRVPPSAISSEIKPEPGELEVSGLTVKQALTSSRVWLLIAALTLAQLSVNGVLYNVVSYLIGQNFTSAKAVSIYSFANLCGLPGLFICGFLADRFGARRIIPFAALVLAGGTFSLLSVTGTADVGVFALIGFVVMWGLGSSIPSQIGPIILAELVGMRSFPALMGIRGAVVGLIGATAPILVGVLFAVNGNYSLPFIVCGLLALLAIPLYILAVRPRPL